MLAAARQVAMTLSPRAPKRLPSMRGRGGKARRVTRPAQMRATGWAAPRPQTRSEDATLDQLGAGARLLGVHAGGLSVDQLDEALIGVELLLGSLQFSHVGNGGQPRH